MENINKIKLLKQEVDKVIIGKEREVELFTIALLFNGHILMESVPGTGKTMIAKSYAKTINGTFSRIQFTADVLPSDVTGIQFFNPKNQDFEFRPGPILANIVLADEINRATPRTQSSLLEVMEERQVTIDGHTIQLDDPFMVIATQNPVESQQGTFPLPIAQMDRFLFKISMEYPSYEEEKQILRINRDQTKAPKVSSVIGDQDIREMRKAVENITISEDVEAYLLNIVRATREHPGIELGVSPRGAIALMRASQGHALLEGRSFVVPNDIKAMAPYVIGHRVFLFTEASLTKTPEKLVEEIIKSVTVPVEAGAL